MAGITESLTVSVLTVESQRLKDKLLQVAIGRLYCAKHVERLHVTSRASHVPPYRRLPHGGAGVCADNAMPGE